MAGAGEAVDDERIPGVPDGKGVGWRGRPRIREAVQRGALAAVGRGRVRSPEQAKQERNRGNIRAGEKQLIEERAIRNPAETGEKKLSAGRVNCAEIAVIDLLPIWKLGA